MTADSAPWTHHDAVVDGIRLHYVAAGPEDGELVVLLHGFPECWYSWHDQIPALAEAGYRVIAPDLRGFNRSEKPAGVSAYDSEELVGDVVGLIHHAGRESAHVVGHDWGGAVAWALAIGRPDMVDRLAILNSPHPSLFARELRTNRDQQRKSWYMFAFQVPVLPEILLSAGNSWLLDRLFLRSLGRDGETFSAEERRRFREAFSRPGAARATLNYYRSTIRGMARQVLSGEDVADLPVTVPTLVLWGEQDDALSLDLLDGLDDLIEALEVETFPEAGHFLQADEPEAVSVSLVEYFGRSAPAADEGEVPADG